jgi:signal transduction histidine kinase/CheY-like chemotaxis protein/ligand-binding sensor domain-containing protein
MTRLGRDVALHLKIGRIAVTASALCILLGLLGSPLMGLDPRTPLDRFTIDRWNWRQGLPEETSTAIRQSSDGYLWIATANGLYRFNGTQAIEVPLPKAKFTDRRLRTLEVDRNGLVWVMSTSGAIWRNLSSSSTSQAVGANAKWLNIVASPKGTNYTRAWIGFFADRARVLDDHKVVDYPQDTVTGKPLSIINLPPDSIASTIAPDGLIYSVREKGQVVSRLPDGSWRHLFTFPSERIHSIQAGKSGQSTVLWLRTGSSLLRWQAGSLTHWQLPVDFIGPSTYFPFLEDRQGTIWLGGRGKLAKFEAGQLKVLQLGAEQRETPVSALFEDREGALWIGTLTGAILRLRDCGAYTLGRAEGFAGDVINSILVDPPSSQNVPETYFVHSMNQGITSVGPQMQSVFDAHYGNLWFSARDPLGGLVVGNGERQFEVRNGNFVEVPDRYLPKLGVIKGWWRDKQAGGYIVARTSGIYRQSSLVNPSELLPGLAKARIAQYPNAKLLSFGAKGVIWASDGTGIVMASESGETAIQPPDQTAEDAIYCLRWDQQNEILWVGTNRGVFTWDPVRNRFGRRGIEADQVFLLEKDTVGSIWAATRNGLVRIEAQSWLAGGAIPPLRLLHSDGLRNVNFGMTRGQGSAILTDGRLLFASMGGLVILNPASIRPMLYAPSPSIEQIQAGESNTAVAEDGTLPAGTRRVEIKFDAFSVSTNSPVRVEYLLKGVDEKWMSAGNRRTVQYTNLRPGSYQFLLRAGWPDGSGEGQVAATWSIPPQFHEHHLFLVTLACATLFAAVMLVRQRSISRRRREQELQTRVEERTRELNEAKRQAEVAARVKADFLASMSHELRTPMNGVLGLAELLDATPLNQEQGSLLKTLRSSGESLLALVNDILDLSKIESGKFELERIPVCVPRLLHETAELIRPLAEKKGLLVQLTSEGDSLDWIEADPGRLRQILLNLIGNAIKFTPAGKVQIHAAWGQDLVRIEVRDNGIGIPEDKVGHLFQNFVQVDSSTTRVYGGTGLGLAIARRLVEAMRGEIQCTSQVGIGSCFSFWIPALPCEAPRIAVETRSKVDLTGFKLLVAEDNSTNQLVIRGLLEKLNAKPKIVANGLEAVEAVQTEHFDCVLMDCQMPILDGYEAARRIKQQLGAKAPPIIALTANALLSDKQRCMEAGMEGYLTKPISSDRLREVLAEFLLRVKI